jgi:hypothetical protein
MPKLTLDYGIGPWDKSYEADGKFCLVQWLMPVLVCKDRELELCGWISMACFFASNESHRDVSWNVVILVVQDKFSYSLFDLRGQGIAQRESFSRSLIVILRSMRRRARPSSTHPRDWTRQLYTMDSPRINIKSRPAGGFALQRATLEKALQHALERWPNVQ